MWDCQNSECDEGKHFEILLVKKKTEEQAHVGNRGGK
jgi:hypothetical protein